MEILYLETKSYNYECGFETDFSLTTYDPINNSVGVPCTIKRNRKGRKKIEEGKFTYVLGLLNLLVVQTTKINDEFEQMFSEIIKRRKFKGIQRKSD
jgi:hypothetical protein